MIKQVVLMTVEDKILEAKSWPQAIRIAAELRGNEEIEFWKPTNGISIGDSQSDFTSSRALSEFYDSQRAFASFLLDMDLRKGNHGEGTIIPTFMECNKDYLLIETAINSAGYIAGSIYTDDPEDLIVHKIKDMDAEMIIVDTLRVRGKPSHLDDILRLKNQLPGLKYAISTGKFQDDIALPENLQLFSFEDLPKRNVARVDEIVDLINPDDLMKVIYTSGTSGKKPKGAMWSHRNLLENIKSAVKKIDKINSEDKLIAYLPHAHSFGSLIYPMSLIFGVKQFYSHKFDLKYDLPKVRPDIFVSVPKGWETIVTKVKEKFSGWKYSHLVPLLRPLILKKAGLNNLKYLISGAASHSPELLSDLRKLFGRDLHLGYGSTENTAAVSINMDYIPISSKGHASIGEPFPGIKLHIIDNNGNEVHEEGIQGRLTVESHGNFMGYLREKRYYRKIVDVGDGAYRENGNIFVYGRTGENIKLRDGQLHHMPTVASRLLGEYIKVAVAMEMNDKTLGIISIDYNPDAIQGVLSKVGVGEISIEDVTKEQYLFHPKVVEAIKAEALSLMDRIRNDPLINTHEKFDHVLIYRPPFPKNQELTSTTKIIESKIIENCREALCSLVSQGIKIGIYNPSKGLTT